MVQEFGDTKAVTWAPPSDSSTVAIDDQSSIKANHSRRNGNRIKAKRAIGEYKLLKTLGSGGMGKVKLAVHQNDSHKKIAVKIIRRTGSKDDEFREERTLREANILSLLHHPYIVNLKAPIVLDTHYYYLMMEYVSGGQLLDYIISHGKLKEKHARRFARQIMSALDYCHRNSIVHRDLKIENILISRTGHVKIIDFGLSNLFSPDSPLSTFCGSLYFAAPELLSGKTYNGPSADVWSFGIVLYVLVCGKVPFDDQSTQTLHEKIKRGSVDYPLHLTPECRSLLSKVLVTNPSNRSTVSEIMVHPWMLRGYDGPIENHIPPRQPLTLPLDMAVVRRMTVFTKFGTEEEIKEHLEQIITSEQFQEASRLRTQRSCSHSRNGSTSSTGSSGFFSILSSSNNTPTFPVAKDDPQSLPNAYHPLVSIYYLVKERIERECQDESPAAENRLPAPDSAASLAPNISQKEEQGPRIVRHQKSASLATATLPPALPMTHKVPQKRNGRGHKKAKSHAPVISVADNEPKPSTSTEHSHNGLSRKFSTFFSRHSDVSTDEHVRPVYLKGLFSMTTTSTKTPAVIRSDLIHVLDSMSLDWCESQGSFECTQQQSVRFEIYIVRVPWLLGMHGLQFRRISGNSWVYKSICSSILTELKL
ncbi:kinase-like domain-containing protein [Fennellomyces sp. T-0311]|nr:kinase-like domain-containing protein [Fennellomyces sp. T-0311]